VCLRDLLHFFQVLFLFPKKGSDGLAADRSIEKSRKSVCILVLVSSNVVKGQGGSDGLAADRSIEKSRKSVCILVLVSSDVVKGQGVSVSA
jgi:hypothetical protein